MKFNTELQQQQKQNTSQTYNLLEPTPQQWILPAWTLIPFQVNIDLPTLTRSPPPPPSERDQSTLHAMHPPIKKRRPTRAPRLSYLQCSQQGSLPLGADTGCLVVHVKINEGGVSLQTRPICMDPVANASAHIHHQSSRVTFNVLTVVFPGRRGNTRLSRLIKYANKRANLQSCSQRSRSGVADCIERQV